MSISVPYASLSDEQQAFLRQQLNLQPVDPDAGRWTGPGRQQMAEVKAPVSFYLVNGDRVHLPFLFGRKLFQKDAFDHPVAKFNFTGSLFEHQKPVIEEARSHLRENRATTIGLAPGQGKTIMGACLAADLKLYTGVLFHRTTLAPQWQKTFQDFTDADTWIVGESPMPEQMPRVTLCMDTRVSLLPDWYRKRIGLLIVDEAHAFCTPSHVSSLLLWEPQYVIAETATLIRADGMHLMIQAMCGMHGIFKISDKPFQVVRMNTGLTPPTTKKSFRGQQRLDYGALKNYLWQNEYRNNLIVDLIVQNRHRKILVLTGSVKIHIPILRKKLQALGIEHDWFAGTKKTYKDSPVLIGTTEKIGTGFDEKSFCATFNGIRLDMVILTTSMKSLPQLDQNVGRVFRSSSPIVVDLVDDNSTLKSHWSIRKNWYVSRNGQIEEYHMPKYVDPGQILQGKPNLPAAGQVIPGKPNLPPAGQRTARS